MLDEKWFAERDFFSVPPDEIDGHILYAHRKGAFMNRFGHLLKHGFCPAKRKRNNRVSGKVYPYMTNYRAYCHRLIGRTFLRKLNKGEVFDHINGDISNYSVSNLRIVTKATNDRDGGFLKMLRNRGIDPTAFKPACLLAYFGKMARYRSLFGQRAYYTKLTKPKLLRLLTGQREACI